jgi:type I restriction enzyme M protein
MSSDPDSTAAAARLVRKLWQYCGILRDDGLSYPDYVEQLTYLLFLKMSDEIEDGPVPVDVGWRSFALLEAETLHDAYSRTLSVLSERDGMLGLIFRNARNKIRDPAKLRLLVVELIGQTEWTGLSTDVKGDAYEGLLEKNARDTKSGAGQYFTPRVLIDAIVKCIDPKPGEIVCDPACGTAGFLLAAHRHIRESTPDLTESQLYHLQMKALRGVELVEEVARLAAMNLVLHGVGGDKNDQLPIARADSLRSSPTTQVNVVLTNPPFGVRGSVTYSSDDKRLQLGDELTLYRPDFWVDTANKQLNFLQHVFTLLKPGGRAAVVVPDNVLYEDGAAASVRRGLLENCDVHTILRLPAGLFYASGLKSNVLFFDRNTGLIRASHDLMVYDLRSDKRFSLKARPIQRSDLSEFVELYRRKSRRDRAKPQEDGRSRLFDQREVLSSSNCSLDLKWRTPAIGRSETRSRLDEISLQIAEDLQRALEHVSRAAGSKDLLTTQIVLGFSPCRDHTATYRVGDPEQPDG